MDEAKVVINIKEGIIELQGPVDFVRHYLDTYQFAIKELQGLPKDIGKGRREEIALPRRRTRVTGGKERKRERASCDRTLRGYLETGFFDEPRSPREVKQHLTEAGFTFSDSMVRANLRGLYKTGLIDRTGKGRSVHYRCLAQS